MSSPRLELRILILALAAVALLAAGCGDTTGNGNPGSNDTGPGTDSGEDTGAGDDLTDADDDTGEPDDTSTTPDTSDPGDTTDPGDTAATASYRIDPASQSLTLAPGEQAQVAFQLVSIATDGTESNVAAEAWSVTPPALATITNGGLLTTTGVSGGSLTVRADIGGSEVATAVLDLQMTVTDVGDDDPSVLDLFPPTGSVSADPSLQVDFVYPYDAAVLPSGVYPPVLQWTDAYAGASDARFRIQLQRGPVLVDIVTDGAGVPECPTDTANGRCYAITIAQWRALAEASAAEQLDVRLWGRRDQDPANPSFEATPLQLRLVSADLSGEVYYYYVTDSGSGAIQQISVELGDQRPTNTRVLTNETRCHGCHTLSRDGRRLATEIESGSWPNWESAVLDLDVADDASQWLASPEDDKNWYGVAYAFNPDGTKLLSSWVDTAQNNRQHLTLQDLDTLAQSDVLMDAAHPTWSPDGGLVAYTHVGAIGGDGNDPRIDVADSDLYRMTASEQADGSIQWGTPELLVDGNGQAISWPSFSPDSSRIAYSQGELARLTEHTAGTARANSLYLVPSTGGTPVHLARTSLSVGDGGERYDLQPVFSPFVTDSETGERFYWMLFQSIRPYGVVTPTLGRHQLWVAAISATDLANGVDPSHPAFYLPGQDTATNNVMGFWAADPCGKSYDDGTADSCTLSNECCAGYVCSAAGQCEQQDQECIPQGGSCTDSSQCCGFLTCATNTAGDLVCQEIFN